MKSFKRFIAIAVLPIFIIGITSNLFRQSFNHFSDFKLNIYFYLIGYFTIISFCTVFIYEYFAKTIQSKVVTYAYAILILAPLLFMFSLSTFYFLFYFFSYSNALFSTILGMCIFLTISFALEIYKHSDKHEILKIKEKPFYFVKSVVIIAFILSILLFFMTSDSYLYKFNAQQIWSLVADIYTFNLTIAVVSIVILIIIYEIIFFRKNIIIGIILASLISYVLVFSLHSLFYKNVFMGNHHLFIWTFLCCFSFSTMIIYRNKIKNLSLSLSKKETEYLQLKYQVNPHFLFNNLNTLIAFIETNPKKAVEFGNHLSNIYRHYLKNGKDDFVLLATEIDFIKEYAAIFKAKFESGFDFKIENETTENQYVLSLCLQELIDNIFKHNTLDIENPLEIKLTILPTELIIKNTKLAKDVNHSTKIGLENISKRYQLLTQKKIIITDSIDFFEVKIPLIKLIK